MDEGMETAGTGKKGRGLTVFLIGVVFGVAATLLVPRYLGPYLPVALRGETATVDGTVTAKERQEERLLLTVSSLNGATLATFERRVAEIDLLVDVGDSVSLALKRVEPFVSDPSIRRVWKGPRGTEAAERKPEVVPPDPAAGPSGDTAPAGETTAEPQPVDTTETSSGGT